MCALNTSFFTFFFHKNFVIFKNYFIMSKKTIIIKLVLFCEYDVNCCVILLKCKRGFEHIFFIIF